MMDCQGTSKYLCWDPIKHSQNQFFVRNSCGFDVNYATYLGGAHLETINIVFNELLEET